MSPELNSILLGTLPVWIAFGIAVRWTIGGPMRQGNDSIRAEWNRMLWIAIVIQAVHSYEEWSTGFPVRYPALLGLVPWPESFFIAFNLGWLAIWLMCAVAIWFGVALSRNAIQIPIRFLAVSLLMNGFAHPLLGLAAGGYFPGFVSGWAAGVIGWMMVARIRRATTVQ